MNPRGSVVVRFLAVSFILSLSSPNPALALRDLSALGKKDRATGLEEALRNPVKAIRRFANDFFLGLAPTSAQPAGAEESSEPEVKVLTSEVRIPASKRGRHHILVTTTSQDASRRPVTTQEEISRIVTRIEFKEIFEEVLYWSGYYHPSTDWKDAIRRHTWWLQRHPWL